MSKYINVTSSKWFGAKNGEDFSLLTSDFTKNITASIFEKVKVILNIEIFTILDLEDFYLNSTSLYMPNATFTNDVNVGDIMRVYLVTGGDSLLVDVTSVSDEIIYFTIITNDGVTIPATYEGTDKLIIETPLTFLKYSHGLVASTDSDTSYISKLDGQNLSFLVDDIGLGSTRDTTFKDGEATAINSNYGSLRARFVSNTQIPMPNAGSEYSAQNYEIEHIFLVQDYSDADIQNYLNLIPPTQYVGESTLNYNAKLEFRTIGTNPETSKIVEYISKGNIGFFNESLNGRTSKYSIQDVIITRVANDEEITNVIAGETVKLTFNIESTAESFITTPKIVLTHFTMLESGEYEFSTLDFSTIFSLSQVYLTGLTPNVDGVFTNASITNITDNVISVETDITTNILNLDGKDYFISVLVQDESLTNETTDKVQLIVKSGQYLEDSDVLDLITNESVEIYPRNMNPYTQDGYTSMDLISGELIYLKYKFDIDVTVFLNSMKLETLSGYPPLTNIFASVVTTENIDTTGIDYIDLVQLADYEIPTPYKSGLNGHLTKTETDTFTLIYPYRVPFAKERKVEGLDPIIYDNTEENKGFNESLFYQQSKGLKVAIALRLELKTEYLGVIKYTDYRILTPDLEIVDFEENL